MRLLILRPTIDKADNGSYAVWSNTMLQITCYQKMLCSRWGKNNRVSYRIIGPSLLSKYWLKNNIILIGVKAKFNLHHSQVQQLLLIFVCLACACEHIPFMHKQHNYVANASWDTWWLPCNKILLWPGMWQQQTLVCHTHILQLLMFFIIIMILTWIMKYTVH